MVPGWEQSLILERGLESQSSVIINSLAVPGGICSLAASAALQSNEAFSSWKNNFLGHPGAFCVLLGGCSLLLEQLGLPQVSFGEPVSPPLKSHQESLTRRQTQPEKVNIYLWQPHPGFFCMNSFPSCSRLPVLAFWWPQDSGGVSDPLIPCPAWSRAGS